MTSESKILTVSYGTFSCTLEGYDDPFDTMKAIAEYFRGLAGDDRYFGAEPPQPDAAMLHRIAEREVSRIVDSRVNASPPASEDGDDSARLGGIVVHKDVPTEPTVQDVIPPGVAAKLARIRQSAGLAAPAPAAEAGPDALAGTAVAETAFAGTDTAPLADDVLSRIDLLTTAPADEIDLSDDSPATPAPVEGVSFDADAAPMLVDALPEDLTDLSDVDTANLAPDQEWVADIAASEAESGMAGPGVLLPERTVDGTSAADPEGLSADPASTDVALAAEFSAETAVLLAEDAISEPEAFNPSDQVTDLLTPPAEFHGPADEPVAKDHPPLAPMAEETLLPTFANILSDEGPAQDTPDDALVTALIDNLAADDLAPVAVDPVGDALPEDATVLADDSLPEDAPDAPTLADARQTDPLPEENFPEPAPVAVAAPVSKFGSKAKRVNSRVVRIHPDDNEQPPADPQATRILDNKDADFARLLRQADDVMSEDENRRRLDSIAHLKAAVAATEADRAAGAEVRPNPDTRQDAYRDDLAQMAPPEPEAEVKPHRIPPMDVPQDPRPGTIRPGMISPPPLVLVSEQRIDRIVPPTAPAPAPVTAPAPAAQALSPPQPDHSRPMVALRTGRLTGAIGAAAASPVAPVQKLVLSQPPRSASVDPDEDDDLDDDLGAIDEVALMSFAEQTGAKSMADLLEAAAAYATCVEGRGQFTRPQLMRRLMACAGGKAVSREDGLRSFGTLLRTGRIEKVSRGHYVLSAHSPYLAEARRLG